MCRQRPKFSPNFRTKLFHGVQWSKATVQGWGRLLQDVHVVGLGVACVPNSAMPLTART